jgi:hypothetical protein
MNKSITMPSMAQSKKPSDRHKPSRMVRIRERLAQVLEQLAERNDTDVTEEANRAIREHLEQIGMWPPKDGKHTNGK